MMIRKTYKKIILKIKNHFKKIFILKMSSHDIAMGFSVGTLIALLPTFGLAYFFGLGVIFITPKINKISLLLGIAFWNPLVLAPIYRYSYKLGSFIWGDLPGYTFKLSFSEDIIRVSSRFLLGNIIISLSVAILVYFLIIIVSKALNRDKNKSVGKEVSKV